jgi:hypothetical protein
MHPLIGWHYRAVALLALSLAAGCSSGPSSARSAANGPPATFTQIYSEIFPLGTKAQCNYCHDRPANEISNGMLNMGHTQTDSYAAVVGTSSMSAKCGGTYTLVVPGESSASLLFLKLEETPPCGDRMPQGGSPLTSAQLEMVRSWVDAGAMNN